MTTLDTRGTINGRPVLLDLANDQDSPLRPMQGRRCYQGDGSSVYVEFPNIGDQVLPITLACRIQHGAVEESDLYEGLVGRGFATTANFWLGTRGALGNPQQINCAFAGTMINVASQIVANEALSIVATYDGAFIRLYKNGRLIGEQAKTGALLATADPTLLMDPGIKFPSEGVKYRHKMIEAIVDGTAWTAQQALAYHQGQIPSASIIHAKLDESSGRITYNSATSDRTKDGTIIGGTESSIHTIDESVIPNLICTDSGTADAPLALSHTDPINARIAAINGDGGRALSLDGSSSASGTPVVASTMTVAFWLVQPIAAAATILDKGVDLNVSITLAGDLTLQGVTLATAVDWTAAKNVSIAVNGTSAEATIDGTPQGSQTIAAISDTGQTLTIGANLTGTIDAVIVHESTYGFDELSADPSDRPQDVVGYTLSDGATYYSDSSATQLIEAGVRIPRDESHPTKCTAYTAPGVQADLQFNGKGPKGGSVLSGALEADGSSVYLSIPGLVGTETVTSSQGTSTPTVSAGRIDLTAGTIWQIELDNGDIYPCTEIDGRGVYSIKPSGAQHATITGGTLSTIRAARQDHVPHNMQYGSSRYRNLQYTNSVSNYLQAWWANDEFAGDFEVRWIQRADKSNISGFQLSSEEGSVGFTDIPNGIHVSSGMLYSSELGLLTEIGNADAGDVLGIRRVGTAITYLHNNDEYPGAALSGTVKFKCSGRLQDSIIAEVPFSDLAFYTSTTAIRQDSISSIYIPGRTDASGNDALGNPVNRPGEADAPGTFQDCGCEVDETAANVRDGLSPSMIAVDNEGGLSATRAFDGSRGRDVSWKRPADMTGQTKSDRSVTYAVVPISGGDPDRDQIEAETT